MRPACAQLPPKRIYLVKFVFQRALLSLTLILLSPAVMAQTWQINLQDADVTNFVSEVANITGRSFVLDPSIRGKVNVISERPLNSDEVYELFLSVLDVNGISAVPSGNSVKLVPQKDAGIGAPVDLRGTASGQTLVTRVITLRNANVADVLPAVRPLLPTYAQIAAVPSLNALVVSDRASSLNQVEELIRALDGDGTDKVEVISLSFTDPETMLQILETLTGVSTSTSGGSRLKLIADVNNSRLIVRGSAEARAQIRDLVAELDEKPSRRLSGLRVFKLKFADARHIANMLRGLLNNESLDSSSEANQLQLGQSGLAQSTINQAQSSTNSSLRAGLNRNAAAPTQSQSSSRSVGGGAAEFSIIADETQNAIVVNANPEIMIDVEEAIAALDVRRAQVLIQAAIVEVSGDSVDQLGVQWAVGGPDNGIGITNFNTGGASLASLATAALSGSNLAIANAAQTISGGVFAAGATRGDNEFYGAVIQAIQTTSNANLLSMPSILTLDNEEASILVGQNVPFITGSITTAATQNPFQTIERQDVGINLTVIPHIGDGGQIRLEVVQEVSDVVPTSANIQTADIVTNKRSIKTTILADNKQTIALGGLISDRATQTVNKVPLIGDLPFIGSLFRARQNNGSKTNLIVFLQPTILNDSAEIDGMTQRRYEHMRIMQLEMDEGGNFNRVLDPKSSIYP